MRNSDRKYRFAGILAFVVLPLFSGCAQCTSDRLAYRERLEAGLLTPEDVVRFKTPDAERQLRAADANEAFLLVPHVNEYAIFSAVTQNNAVLVKTLLTDKNASFDVTDIHGNTPLLIAARNGNVEITHLLLKAGADPNGRGDALPPLASAAINGHLQVMTQLLKYHADIELMGVDGLTPLWTAVQVNNVAATELLLKKGAASNGFNQSGENMLVHAVRENKPTILSVLLKYGFPVDMLDQGGHTALYWSTLLQQDALTSQLLDRGAKAEHMTGSQSIRLSVDNSWEP